VPERDEGDHQREPDERGGEADRGHRLRAQPSEKHHVNDLLDNENDVLRQQRHRENEERPEEVPLRYFLRRHIQHRASLSVSSYINFRNNIDE